MSLGSEFRFHGSISKPPTREGEGMFHYQLKSGKEWTTQNTVTAEVAERIREVMAKRERKGTLWRLMDASKPASKPRAKKATAKPAEVTGQDS